MLSYLVGRFDPDRRRRFVGRVIERDLFRSAIATPELLFNVLYVFGAGGVGNDPAPRYARRRQWRTPSSAAACLRERAAWVSILRVAESACCRLPLLMARSYAWHYTFVGRGVGKEKRGREASGPFGCGNLYTTRRVRTRWDGQREPRSYNRRSRTSHSE